MQSKWIVKDCADGVTEEMLLEAVKSAYSIESHAGHGIEDLSAEYIGTVYAVERPDALYLVYRGGGMYLYESMRVTPSGTVGLYESIFGHPERKAEHRRRKGN